MNIISQTFKISCSRPIMHNSFWLIVLFSIQFNNQLCTTAIKIHNISSKLFLPSELPGMLFQKFIPQALFMNCRFPPQLLCPLFQGSIIVNLLHDASIPSFKTSLPLWGRWHAAGMTDEVLRHFPSFHSSIICAADRVISSLNSLFHLRLVNASSQRSNSSPAMP